MMIYDITAIYTESQSKRNSGERPTREQMRAEFEKIDKQLLPFLPRLSRKSMRKWNRHARTEDKNNL